MLFASAEVLNASNDVRQGIINCALDLLLRRRHSGLHCGTGHQDPAIPDSTDSCIYACMQVCAHVCIPQGMQQLRERRNALAVLDLHDESAKHEKKLSEHKYSNYFRPEGLLG